MASGSDISVEVARSVDDELADAVTRLVPLLSSSAAVPSRQELNEIVSSPASALLVARDAGRIAGMLTLAVFRIPTGVRAWIEDVVVDGNARGRGIGEALTREAIRLAAARGARTVELTSRASREAANRLYRRLGFEPRETNVYRYTIRSTD
jgi:ribosomal protein S18 acetylase RimI-like enzyme